MESPVVLAQTDVILLSILYNCRAGKAKKGDEWDYVANMRKKVASQVGEKFVLTDSTARSSVAKLKKEGLVESYQEAKRDDLSHRPRVFYKITKEGTAALKAGLRREAAILSIFPKDLLD